ncbi:MAG: efflux RND transporter periplasmic adaptor subunit [candidate division Zixibacteria bacterium]|nr:efflux RND transporter periplasmic adaptor subunit [candidate division Zixibacteria bacterium]
MKKRMSIMLIAMGIFIATVGTIKFLQIHAAIAQGASYQPPPEAVTTTVANVQDWPTTLNAIGSVAAVHGVILSADLPGVVSSIEFESGRPVKAGEVLVRLETSQEQAQLNAAEAQRELAQLNFKRASGLYEKRSVAQSEYDLAAAQFKQAEAHVKEVQAMIDRKLIRAPFAGELGIRQVNLGQYLRAGDPIVPLQSMDPIYVNFSLPQQDVAALKVGAKIELTADSITLINSVGRITAINSVVDEGTRNVLVQATFENSQEQLRPGMFVELKVTVGAGSQLITLPSSAVSYAPYGNSVFVVKELKNPAGQMYKGVEQRFVTLGGSRGDQVSIVGGLEPGEEIVTSGVFKLRNGAAVLIDNKVQPSNQADPKPENS